MLFTRVRRMEASVLIGVGGATAGLFAFLQIADEVIEGETRNFDQWLLLSLRDPADLADPIGPQWFEEVMRDFTALGGNGVLTLIVFAAVGYLILVRKRAAALLVLASVGGGIAVASLMKWGFARPRPDLVPHGAEVFTQSFPSSHAMMAAVVYLTLGALLARTEGHWRTKVYLLSLACVVTVLVGFSRVYLGVHWPTDVLAGWAVGATWALLCWLVALWLQSRGEVEQEGS
jgi:undecaprenyl-diphosphatase